MKWADLHIHTHCSDGTMSPQEVVDESIRLGLQCISITDHDTVDGIPQAIESAQGKDLEVLPGIEFSTEINGKDIHVLGYLFNWQDASLQDQLRVIRAVRTERMKKMIVKLEALGIKDISFEEVKASVSAQSLGRPHLAVMLVKKGIVSNFREAFTKFLAEGAAAYVPKFKQSPYEAIQLIKKLGGIAVLAHPMLTNVDELIPGFVEAGLGGLEVYYPNCSDNVINFYKGLAKKYGLATTGGSDAHGGIKQHTFIGKARIQYELIEKLKEIAHSKNV